MNVPPQPRVSSNNTQPSSAVMAQPHIGIGTGDTSGAWVPAALGRRPRHKAQANKPCDNKLGVWNDKAKALDFVRRASLVAMLEKAESIQ